MAQTILVVDDEPLIRELLRLFLESEGYRVLTASSAAEGLDLFLVRTEVDLVLTDVMMPVAAGPEMAADILTISRDTRILFMSGYAADPALLTKYSDCPMLDKPFSKAELLKALRSCLDSKPGRRDYPSRAG